jgi:hypothetical protein
LLVTSPPIVSQLTVLKVRSRLFAVSKEALDDARDATNDLSATYEKVTSKESGPENAGDVHQKFEDLQNKLAKSAAEALIYASKQWKLETYAPPQA